MIFDTGTFIPLHGAFFSIHCIASKACHPRRTARTAGFCASLVRSFFYQYGRPTYERRYVHDGEIHQMSLVSYICQSLKRLHSTFNILRIGFTSNSKLLKSKNFSNLKSQSSRESKTSYTTQSYLTPIQVYKFQKITLSRSNTLYSNTVDNGKFAKQKTQKTP